MLIVNCDEPQPLCSVCVLSIVMRLFGWDCVGRDGIHPCEGGWSPEPQLWRLALSQQQPQPEQQRITPLLSTPRTGVSTLLPSPLSLSLLDRRDMGKSRQ